ncbi:PKD domain-containing protein [Microbulbifer variabilis]|uniref:PKD domain-containing protein n=1 Tax=Microbulbifer variabilis TaxID=266805 RepID=UPI001CFF0F6F|nr:VCBS repeat-containing protein [Microbulbifer variabilis]
MKLKLLSKFFVLPTTVLLLASSAWGEVQFQPAEIYPTGSKAEAIAVADLNNDGRDDVVLSTTGNFDSGNNLKLKVFLQGENGQLRDSIDYPLGGDDVYLPKSIAVGDLNSDGLQDIAVGFDNSRIDVFLQLSDGSLALRESFSSSYASQIAIADVTGDGVSDIVGRGADTIGVAIYSMVGTKPEDYRSFLYFLEPDNLGSLALGDVNDDGVDDIITISDQSQGKALTVLISQGDGDFSPTSYYELDSDFTVYDISVGDLNEDGLNDIWLSVAEGSDASQLAFYQGSDGLLQKPFTFPRESISAMLLSHDLNNDLSHEFMTISLDANSISIFDVLTRNGLSGQSSHSIPEDIYANPRGVDVGDINSDGIPDIVIASPSSGLVLLKGDTQGINLAPLADAGDDQVVQKDQLILLDGSQSADRDGSIIDYRWKQVSGSPVSLNDTSNGFATFLAPSSKNSDIGGDEALVFELEVEDHENVVSVDTAIVTLDGNIPPRAIIRDFQAVKSGEVVILDGSSSIDLFGEIVSYKWRQISGEPVELVQDSEATVSFKAPIISGSPFIFFETMKFELVVTDNKGLESSAVTQVNVQSLASPLAIIGIPQGVSSGEEVLLDGRASTDADGEIVSYNWRSLSDIPVINNQDGTASFIAPEVSPGLKAAFLFELEVVDNDGLKSTGIVGIVVEQNMPSMMPIGLIKGVQLGSLVTLDASGAFDIDGDIVKYQWEQVSGPPVSITNSDRAIASFTAPSEQATLVFSVTLTDDDGESSTFNVSISVFELTPIG